MAGINTQSNSDITDLKNSALVEKDVSATSNKSSFDYESIINGMVFPTREEILKELSVNLRRLEKERNNLPKGRNGIVPFEVDHKELARYTELLDGYDRDANMFYKAIKHEQKDWLALKEKQLSAIKDAEEELSSLIEAEMSVNYTTNECGIQTQEYANDDEISVKQIWTQSDNEGNPQNNTSRWCNFPDVTIKTVCTGIGFVGMGLVTGYLLQQFF